MQRDLRRSHFIPYFDGLRGFGVLIIFACHMSLSGLSSFDLPAPLQFLINGQFAVDMFFALSGCVLAMRASLSDETFFAICVRRWVRLAIPAAVTCVVSGLMMIAGLYHNLDLAAQNGSHFLASLFHFRPKLEGALREGLFHIFETPQSGYYNRSLWTILPEFWCSIGVFAGVYLFRSWRVCLILSAAAIYLVGIKYQTAPISFCIGVFAFYARELLGRHAMRLAKGWRLAGTLMATVVVIYGVCLGSYPGLGFNSILYTWFPPAISDWQWKYSFGGALVVLAVGASPMFRWLLSLRPMVWLGKISFAFYLVHLPVICSVGAWLGIAFYPTTLVPWLLTFGTVLAIAVPFEMTVDRGAIRLGRFVSDTIDRRLMADRRQRKSAGTVESHPRAAAAG